jgi:hypothetical protein
MKAAATWCGSGSTPGTAGASVWSRFAIDRRRRVQIARTWHQEFRMSMKDQTRRLAPAGLILSGFGMPNLFRHCLREQTKNGGPDLDS